MKRVFTNIVLSVVIAVFAFYLGVYSVEISNQLHAKPPCPAPKALHLVRFSIQGGKQVSGLMCY